MDALRDIGVVPSAKFDLKDVPDLSGRVALVTGGSAGIGASIVKALAGAGARVVFLSNKEDHASDTLTALRAELDDPKIEWQQVDLSDLSQTNKVAQELASKEKRIDMLIANAGLGVGKPFATAAGLDAHMTVNHLSQFLLVNRLLPNIRQTVSSNPPPPSARIVFQSSELHRAADKDFQFSPTELRNARLSPAKAYSRTKLAQILFAKGLVDKAQLDAKKILSVSVHPGGVATDQQEQAKEAYGGVGKATVPVVKPLLRSPDHGALCSVWAAVSPKLDQTDSQGKYYNDPDTEGQETKQAGDDELIQNIFESSEAIINEVAGPDAIISWTQGI